jgi:hypothetical protein
MLLVGSQILMAFYCNVSHVCWYCIQFQSEGITISRTDLSWPIPVKPLSALFMFMQLDIHMVQQYKLHWLMTPLPSSASMAAATLPYIDVAKCPKTLLPRPTLLTNTANNLC